MKTVLRYFKPYIPLLILIVAFLFGQAMCELALPGYMSDIINNGIVAQDMPYIRSTGVIMIIIAAGSAAFAVLTSLFASRASAKTTRDIRRGLFKKVTSFSTAELDQFSTASLITRSTNDVQMVQQTTVAVLRMAFYAPIMGIGAVIRALNTSVPLSWTIGLALAAILGIMIAAFTIMLPKFQALQKKLDKVNLIMKERLSGMLVIRAFTTEKSEEERFDDANKELMKINLFVNRAMSFMMPSLMFVMNGVSLLIVWAGAHLVESQDLLIGDLLAYIQYAMQVIMAFLLITMMFIMIPRAVVCMKRVGEVLDVEPSIEDPEVPVKQETSVTQKMPGTQEMPAAQEKTAVVETGKGLVEFQNVSFTYPGAEEKTLEDISFAAEPGKTTAIIGGTGSGKSTLVSLIPRFYDVTEGKLKVDGVDVKDLTQHDLRDKIGYVPQKGMLFSGTIASNLRYGDDDATDEELMDAIETAQATEFIDEKEDGIYEEVAQGGTNVSGGQKQRLSIARALVKKPEIYIFDDSFSALDFKTDKALRSALKEKVGQSTIIIVAQRINTIMDADRIVVLDDGKVAGIGGHEQLMESCGVYREIALSQLSEEELERGRE